MFQGTSWIFGKISKNFFKKYFELITIILKFFWENFEDCLKDYRELIRLFIKFIEKIFRIL